MKKTLSVLMSAAVAATVIFSSCQKNNATLSQSSQIVGKWTMRQAIGNYTVNGDNRKDTTAFTTADYFEFRADSTLTIQESGVVYSGNWEISNSKLIITNTHYMDYGNGFDMPILNNTDLQLYYTESNSFSTLEMKLNLAK